MPGTPPLAAGPPLFLAAAGPLSLQRLEPPAADRLVDQLAQIALAEDERLERTPTTTTLSPPAEDPSTSDSSPAVSSKSSPDSPSWAPAMPVRLPGRRLPAANLLPARPFIHSAIRKPSHNRCGALGGRSGSYEDLVGDAGPAASRDVTSAAAAAGLPAIPLQRSPRLSSGGGLGVGGGALPRAALMVPSPWMQGGLRVGGAAGAPPAAALGDAERPPPPARGAMTDPVRPHRRTDVQWSTEAAGWSRASRAA